MDPHHILFIAPDGSIRGAAVAAETVDRIIKEHALQTSVIDDDRIDIRKLNDAFLRAAVIDRVKASTATEPELREEVTRELGSYGLRVLDDLHDIERAVEVREEHYAVVPPNRRDRTEEERHLMCTRVSLSLRSDKALDVARITWTDETPHLRFAVHLKSPLKGEKHAQRLKKALERYGDHVVIGANLAGERCLEVLVALRRFVD